MATQVIGVRMRDASRIYHYALPEEPVFIGEYVVVETPRGQEMGHIVSVPDGDGEIPPDVRPIVRLATGDDRDQALQMQSHALELLQQGRILLKDLDLDMYLAGFSINLEGTEATGHFQADSHTNFRDLVRGLEDESGLHIHMQHAGPRDRAKIVDGYDICGLRLCCSSWMTEFPKVGIRMAKEQDLPLNPDKISGVCGRLLCCLTFEFDVYREMRGQLPKVGKTVSTPAGMGRVVQVNPLAEQITIQVEGSRDRIQVPASEIGLAVRIEEAPNQALVVERQEREQPPASLRRRSEAPPEEETEADQAEPSRRRRRRRRRRGPRTETDGAGEPRAEGTAPAEKTAPAGRSAPAGRRPRPEPSAGSATDGSSDDGPPADGQPRRRRRRRRRRSDGPADSPASNGNSSGGGNSDGPPAAN